MFYVNDKPEDKFLYTETVKLYCTSHVTYPFPADKEALTKGEEQTPVFYAAKSDATNSLKALIKKQCKYKLVRDYKGRTPIHVAAELG